MSPLLPQKQGCYVKTYAVNVNPYHALEKGGAHKGTLSPNWPNGLIIIIILTNMWCSFTPLRNLLRYCRTLLAINEDASTPQ